MSQVMRSPKKYDAVIVGSGAGGDMAAYVLTKAGAKCLMLEAGIYSIRQRIPEMFVWPYEAPHRGRGAPEKPNGFFDPGAGRLEYSWRTLH